MTAAGDLAALGAHLRGAGLTPRALAAWAGPGALPALRGRLAALAASAAPPPPSPAAAALAVFVAGATVERARLRLPLDALCAAGLLERTGASVRATAAVLPVAGGLLVCDRADAPAEAAQVCWPDDSSYHLAGALAPGRRARWLDLACGSAVAPLERPGLAQVIVGVDLNPRAVAFARLGAALSGIAHLAVQAGDIGAIPGTAPLVTCNAPIPDAPEAPDAAPGAAAGRVLWQRTDAGFFARLWPAARAAVEPGGEVVVHAARAAIPDDLPGERVVCIYTPPERAPALPAFAVLWWRPDAPPRLALGHRALTAARPHVDVRDRDDLLAGAC